MDNSFTPPSDMTIEEIRADVEPMLKHFCSGRALGLVVKGDGAVFVNTSNEPIMGIPAEWLPDECPACGDQIIPSTTEPSHDCRKQ